MTEAAHEWQANHENSGFLWRDLPLANALDWRRRFQPQLNRDEQRFLDASQTAEQQREAEAQAARREREALLEARAAERRNVVRLRWFLAIGGVLLALALGAAILAVQGQQVAQERTRAAQERTRAAQQQALASAAQAASFRGELDQELALALAAIDKDPAHPPNEVTAIVYRAADTTARRRFSGHTAGVSSVAFSSDGKTALSASDDKTLRLWDIATGQPIRTFQGHTSGVNGVAFSPDSKTALSASGDQTLRLWPVGTLADQIAFVRANRYVPALSCVQRAQYGVEPLCPAASAAATATAPAPATLTP